MAEVDSATPCSHPLEGNSLLVSIARDQDTLLSLLAQLPALSIARVVGTSVEMSAVVMALLPTVLRIRGRNGYSLRRLDRAEHALFTEDFSSGLWPVGPSAPPPRGPAYLALEVACDAPPGDQAAIVASSALAPHAKLEPGCRVVVETDDDEYSLRRGVEVPHSLSPREEAVLAEHQGSSRTMLLLQRCPKRGGAMSAALSRLLPLLPPLQARWSSSRDDGDDDESFLARRLDARGKAMPNLVGGRTGKRVRAISHRLWDPISPTAPYLRLHGGWRMNFSGVYRDFASPIRPRRISFAIRLNRPCPCRSFFNLFFSCAEPPGGHADVAAFYAGTPFHPPQPHDVFTFLFDTMAATPHGPANHSSSDSEGESGEVDAAASAPPTMSGRPMMWLPSGENLEWPHGFAIGEWHRVEMELNWEDERLAAFIDGVAPNQRNPMHGELGARFGPHQRTLDAANGPMIATDSQTVNEVAQERRRAQRSIDMLRGGFRRIYMFTWLDAARQYPDSAPDIGVADLVLEGDPVT